MQPTEMLEAAIAGRSDFTYQDLIGATRSVLENWRFTGAGRYDFVTKILELKDDLRVSEKSDWPSVATPTDMIKSLVIQACSKHGLVRYLGYIRPYTTDEYSEHPHLQDIAKQAVALLERYS